LAQPTPHAANVVVLLGPPGSCKSSLLLDAMAAVHPDSPLRLATAKDGCVAAVVQAFVALILHKALMRFSVGFPAVTLASAMFAQQWVAAGEIVNGQSRPGYEPAAAAAIASRRLHVLDEVQAMMPFLGQYMCRLQSAHRTAPSGAGPNPNQVLRACTHILFMDPQQSPCREQGIYRVDGHGSVHHVDSSVKMPWVKFMNIFGFPSATTRYHFIVLSGQRRVKGLLFRLLANPCVPTFAVSEQLYMHVTYTCAQIQTRVFNHYMWCSTPVDLQTLSLRSVNVDTNASYITYYRPDMDSPALLVTGVMKTWDYGSPGVPNAAFHWNDGFDTLKDLCVIFITATKAEVKDIMMRLRARSDYGAFLEVARRYVQNRFVSRATRRRDLLTQHNRLAEAMAVPMVPPACKYEFIASEAYAFEYASTLYATQFRT